MCRISQGMVAKTLKMEASQVEPGRAAEYGLDSILVVGLTGQLRKAFPVSQAHFRSAEYRGPRGLSPGELQRALDVLGRNRCDRSRAAILAIGAACRCPCAGAKFRGSSERTQVRRKRFRCILDPRWAIIGLSGRYPRSPNLSEFWRNLSNGGIASPRSPRSDGTGRTLRSRKRQDGKNLQQVGRLTVSTASIRGSSRFRPRKRRAWIPRNACSWNLPSRRRGCRVYAETGRHRKIGVFAGVMNAVQLPTALLLHRQSSFVRLQFQGPSMAVDTACSSS